MTALTLIAGALLLLRILVPLLSGMPEHIDYGQPDLTLHDQRPNQVSSLAEGERSVAPLDAGFDAAVAAVQQLPRTRLVHRADGYAHLTQRSALWGFVDDIQLEARPDAAGVVDIKSSSRLGLSDLGVNRARVERIRADLAAD